jgi:hypothetical protein
MLPVSAEGRGGCRYLATPKLEKGYNHEQRAMRSPIEQREARRISPMALVRRSGLLAMAAGAYMIVLPFVHPSDDVGVQSVAWVPVHLLYFAALTIILLALVGIFARQLQRAGRLGLAGFLTAFVGTAMLLLEGREHMFSPDFGIGTPRGLPELIVASVVFSIGYTLLGSAIVRAGVLPRGAGILLAVGGPIVAFSPPIGVQAVLVVGHVLFGFGLVWLGYALWTGAEHDQSSSG